jgi:hypothetical protein
VQRGCDRGLVGDVSVSVPEYGRATNTAQAIGSVD